MDLGAARNEMAACKTSLIHMTIQFFAASLPLVAILRELCASVSKFFVHCSFFAVDIFQIVSGISHTIHLLAQITWSGFILFQYDFSIEKT
jgi:hypothetical protein